jgi:hypothetical protein
MNYPFKLTILLAGASFLFSQTPPPAAADPGWPRYHTNGTSDLVVYQPQVDSWNDFKVLNGRCAFALTPVRGKEPSYGTFRFTADTLVDADQKMVLLRNVKAFDMRFPSAPGGASNKLSDLTRQLLPTDAMVIALDRVLAFVRAGDLPSRQANVLTDPPPIYVSQSPAVLVIIDGEPVLVDQKNPDRQKVVNTNWDLYRDRRNNSYFLRVQSNWLKAADLRTPFNPATDIPVDLARLPLEQPTTTTAAVSGPVRVIVVHKPSELIVTQGVPVLEPVSSTRLASVSNTESDLFFDQVSQSYYFLTSGRWFRAAKLDGPWSYASLSLPEDFKKIPSNHPRAHVLAAVRGTREADDAVLLAAIPRTAELSRKDAKAEVQYVGSPEFVPVTGVSVSYAKNTPNDVFKVGDRYYLCFQGAWFYGTTANGPWAVAEKVPAEIYMIPESSPKYHVTYVRVYASTPTTVVVGYTPGYYGAYVSGGVVVWGTGYYYSPYVAVGVAAAPVYWGAAYYTYGASAWYNPATGIYARGAAVYGPYGGYGAAAAYNPRTGTYAQGAAIWGPNGGAAAGRTYNPYTGTYSAGYKAANPYGSWGEGVVTNGSNWARGGYQSTSQGTIAAGETSKGGRGVAWDGANGKEGYAAKTRSGDIYAGANGNVYKRDNGQWYQNQNGSWNAMDKADVTAQRQQSAARDLGNRNSQMSERWKNRPSGGGFESRPRPSGPRR